MSSTLITIITVTYNAVTTFEHAIRSVASQNMHVEYIVVDGGSTDGTVEIAERFRDVITTFISEPDKGIYDAMNKGIDRATGQWLYFLGADDQLNEGVLKKIASKLEPKLITVFGDIIYDSGYTMHSRIGARSLLENTLHHQSAFYHRRLFEGFRYDIGYRVISDYELTLRIYLEKQPVLYVPIIIAICGSNGASSVLSSDEMNSLRKRYVHNYLLNNILSFSLDTYYFYVRAKITLKHKMKALLRSKDSTFGIK